jgi:hypothetical protein
VPIRGFQCREAAKNFDQGRTAMWLHHRDMNVSGQPRCPGIFIADDAMLALPSDPLTGIRFPTSGGCRREIDSREQAPDHKQPWSAGIPFERFQFTYDGELAD